MTYQEKREFLFWLCIKVGKDKREVLHKISEDLYRLEQLEK